LRYIPTEKYAEKNIRWVAQFHLVLPEIQTIAARRRRLGLTQFQLADLSGVSQSYIAKLESRKIEPSYTRVKAILEALQRQEQKTEAKASEIMTTNVIGVQATDKVQKAVDLMRSHEYSQLPVFGGGQLVGSISEKTIIDRMANGRDREPVTGRSVGDVMEDAFPQVGDDAPISLITSMLKVYPAVIVSRKGKVAGIVTKADLLKTLI
jgi:predicted transcriptional regulator